MSKKKSKSKGKKKRKNDYQYEEGETCHPTNFTCDLSCEKGMYRCSEHPSYPRSHLAHTALTDKHHSGLVIRKNTKFGFPIYVGIISDDDLDPLDDVIVGVIKKNLERWKNNSIQDKRNIAGDLIEVICDKFPKTEGVAVLFYIDKTCISSLFGDFMNHAMCRQELYFLLNMGTAV